MGNMYFINAITNYNDVNKKGLKIQEWLSPYNRTLFNGQHEFDIFKSQLTEFVSLANDDFPRTKPMKVITHGMDGDKNIAIYVRDEKRCDKVACIVFVKQVSRVAGGDIKRIFSDDQLVIIRDVMAKEIDRYQNTDTEHANELLQIINNIQDHVGNPTFESLEEYKERPIETGVR